MLHLRHWQIGPRSHDSSSELIRKSKQPNVVHGTRTQLTINDEHDVYIIALNAISRCPKRDYYIHAFPISPTSVYSLS